MTSAPPSHYSPLNQVLLHLESCDMSEIRKEHQEASVGEDWPLGHRLDDSPDSQVTFQRDLLLMEPSRHLPPFSWALPN